MYLKKIRFKHAIFQTDEIFFVHYKSNYFELMLITPRVVLINIPNSTSLYFVKSKMTSAR